MKKKIYQKLYKRYISIVNAEEWYEGENLILPKLLNKRVFFVQLFIYKKGKGTDIYFEKKQLNKGIEELIKYFKNNPDKLKELAKKYEKESQQILAFCKKAEIKDMKKLRDTIVKKVWPMISIPTVLGYYSDRADMKEIGKLGLELRKKYDTFVYTAGLKLYELMKEKFPKLIWYLEFLTFNEIESGNLPSINELKKREQGYIYYKGKLYVGKSIDKFTKENNIELIDETAEFKDNEIKGTTAMNGKVKGRVKIVFEIPQMKNVKKGDVLVASMTVPDFLPAMERAAAFVTDEGGITCHAAIVAREMKKPCIIGTKIATKVLKDGDLVEVDADKGVVRKIK